MVADFFSRNPEGVFEVAQPNQLSIVVLENDELFIDSLMCLVIEIPRELEESLNNLAVLQRQDHFINFMITRLERGEGIDFFVIKEGILFRSDDEGLDGRL